MKQVGKAIGETAHLGKGEIGQVPRLERSHPCGEAFVFLFHDETKPRLRLGFYGYMQEFAIFLTDLTPR